MVRASPLFPIDASFLECSMNAVKLDEKSMVSAVIVTFNRVEKLEKVLNAVSRQTYKPNRIFVIDNASTDNTEAMVTSRNDAKIEYIKLPQNIGGAGGFFEGMKAAYEQGDDYLWLMDDDAYPEPDALAVLHKSIADFPLKTGKTASFACSFVKWVDGTVCEMNIPSRTHDCPRFYTDELPVLLVESCSFVSVLIPSWAVQKHGYPLKEYFIWYDDVEYTQRISASGLGILCLQSIVVHDMPENKGADFSLINDTNIWKYCYGARNEASYKYKTKGIIGFISFFVRVYRKLGKSKSTYRMRLKVYKSIFAGLKFRPLCVVPESKKNN